MLGKTRTHAVTTPKSCQDRKVAAIRDACNRRELRVVLVLKVEGKGQKVGGWLKYRDDRITQLDLNQLNSNQLGSESGLYKASPTLQNSRSHPSESETGETGALIHSLRFTLNS